MATSALQYLLPILMLVATRCAARDSFNMVVGTQSIGAAYQFTKEPRLVETARAIHEMGSDVLKFSLELDKSLAPAPTSLAEVTRLDPAVKQVLAMPFASYILWAYPLSTGDPRRFRPDSLADEYREMHDLASALLRDYSGSGKSFTLANWEGDWHLLKLDPERVPSAEEIEDIAAWAKVRQKAIDDARRDTPHKDVQVFFALEVNRVADAIAGKPRLANQVLAAVNPDLVSYSSYDTQDSPEKLKAALDFLEAKLSPKPGVAGLAGRRTFIGEYGFPAASHTPQEQDALSRRVMRAGLEWGCRFVLYWELFNNEVEKGGQQRGFWMIDDQNQKQPVYFTHQKFYERGRRFVDEFRAKNGRQPSREEFGREAAAWLGAP